MHFQVSLPIQGPPIRLIFAQPTAFVSFLTRKHFPNKTLCQILYSWTNACNPHTLNRLKASWRFSPLIEVWAPSESKLLALSPSQCNFAKVYWWSRNFPHDLETFPMIWKLSDHLEPSGWFRNFPDGLEVFGSSGKCLDNLETFRRVWQLSRWSENILTNFDT